MSISRILELHELAKAECRNYPRKRFMYARMDRAEGRHFTGVVGPRGAGKTVSLRHCFFWIGSSAFRAPI